MGTEFAALVGESYERAYTDMVSDKTLHITHGAPCRDFTEGSGPLVGSMRMSLTHSPFTPPAPLYRFVCSSLPS